MSMQAESLEVLEKANVAPAQARAIVRAIEIELAGARDVLATKADVLALQQGSDAMRSELRAETTSLGVLLRSEMAQFAGQFRAEMAQLAAELRGEMAQLAAELRGEMAELAAELRGQMVELAAELRGEMAQLAAGLRSEMAKQLGEVRAEISGVVRQMYVALLGQTTVLLGFFYFFLTQMR
jgi:DNA anti-recombination protein RmuC